MLLPVTSGEEQWNRIKSNQATGLQQHLRRTPHRDSKSVCTHVPTETTLVVDSPIKAIAGNASIISDCMISVGVYLIIVVACIIIVRGRIGMGVG